VIRINLGYDFRWPSGEKDEQELWKMLRDGCDNI